MYTVNGSKKITTTFFFRIVDVLGAPQVGEVRVYGGCQLTVRHACLANCKDAAPRAPLLSSSIGCALKKKKKCVSMKRTAFYEVVTTD